jgi:hypothetical protein
VVLQSRFEDAANAAALIVRGPEPLASQFRSGYGMALNLLHSRSLDAARAFIQRSFDAYLGAWQAPPFLTLPPLPKAFLCLYRSRTSFSFSHLPAASLMCHHALHACVSAGVTNSSSGSWGNQ